MGYMAMHRASNVDYIYIYLKISKRNQSKSADFSTDTNIFGNPKQSSNFCLRVEI